MKNLLAVAGVCLLLSCSTTMPPEVTPQMAAAATGRQVTMAQLERGRILFGSRCIECHALPAVNAHSASQWPHLIDAMAGRASLKPDEQQAMLTYVLAARAQSRF